MAKIDIVVGIDDEILGEVDALAARLGVTRGDVIEDSVRRTLAAQASSDLLDRVQRSSPPTVEMAEHLAYEELRAARAERRSRRA